MRTRLASIVSLAITVGAFGCGSPVETSDVGSIEGVLEGKADGPELSRKVGNLTVWLDSYASFDANGGDALWRLHGRASKNLDDVFAFVPDDAFCEAKLTGKRTFDVLVRQGYELNTLLSGAPLLVRVDPVSGQTGFIQITLAPRFHSFAGASVISIDSKINPVWAGGEVLYRNTIGLKAGWSDLQVTTDDDVLPSIVFDAPGKFHVDFRYFDLELASNPPTDPVYFSAFYNNTGETKSKTARIGVNLVRFEITNGDPYEVWTNPCKAAVKSCVGKSLAKGDLDLADCGTYREVLACGPIALGEKPSLDQVAADFRAGLVGWYADNAGNLDGANTLAQAQAAVSVAGLGEVQLTADDPNGHDTTRFWIFRHTEDVVFPGSDTAWFLAYSKQTGELVELYNFN